MNEKYIASLDIGTTKIITSLACLKPNHQIDVIGLSKKSHKGVKRGIVLNKEEIVNAIKSSIKDLYKQTGIKVNLVNVNINGQHIAMAKKRLSIDINFYNPVKIRTKDFQNHKYKSLIKGDNEIIQVLPGEYIIANKENADNEIDVDFNIITGQSAAIKNVKSCVNLAGLKINNLVSEPIASSFSVLSNDEKEKGIILVDIGAGTTNVVIYYNDIIRHLAVIPFAGNFITSELKKYFNISTFQAEDLKVQFGSALVKHAPAEKTFTVPGIDGCEDIEISLKDLTHIIQWCLEQIIDAILYEIKDSGFLNKLEYGMVLTGGGALLKNINILFKDKTVLNVRLGLPSKLGNNENLFELNDPIYATSIGLLKYHLEDG